MHGTCFIGSHAGKDGHSPQNGASASLGKLNASRHPSTCKAAFRYVLQVMTSAAPLEEERRSRGEGQAEIKLYEDFLLIVYH